MATETSGIDWQDAFENALYIPGAERYPPRWQSQAAAFRETWVNADLDVRYGDGERTLLDLFQPQGTPRGLAVFVHGGFWHKFDKSCWSHLAAGALARGWAVAVPGYTLAPQARISQITAQVGMALQVAAARVSGPIRLAGHSAGGHLVTRMACINAPLTPSVAARIDKITSISGVHDLRPLRLHRMNDVLNLDAAEARAESPALRDPRPDMRLTAWVGGNERPEFLRQTALLTEAWQEGINSCQRVIENDRNHFDVIDGLVSADHALTEAFVG
ncbi:alpha/beta hydrolase [Pseudooceanicola sediminis]|uniref:Alpha/beta hydrolase n=1 Tax=Pseudooceanicola sediminis TaxID=2211117 RepID=A0A399JBT9_9RHOB|nr:alpha/beta hydrolase [Pseudooceanicola sediminis]KAA2314218.1 alpha/beta hydrolase [Puniceibacterium sp. HSS470]RII40086.1 alpha/beta hydrolase [Pseudooceanicola sediminis]